MRKLIYIIPCLGMGGAEVALISAIPTLCNEYNFRVICLGFSDSRLVNELSEHERGSILNFGRFPLNYIKAFFFILRFRPDIMISSLWKAAILGIFVRVLCRKATYIEFIHNSTFFHMFDMFFSKLALKKADQIFCDSISAKIFAGQWTSKPIEVISFLRFTSPHKWEEKKIVQPKALFIGRFHRQKRVDRILDLLDESRKHGAYFSIDCYGRDCGTMNEVKEKARIMQLDSQVFFMGEVPSDKIPDLLKQYDFYIQTSEIEGMAMSVVEAMQHGLVCVVTNVGEIQSYAKNEINAIVIQDNFENDLHRVSRIISKLCNDIEYYNRLSKYAFMQFQHTPTFSISLSITLSKVCRKKQLE